MIKLVVLVILYRNNNTHSNDRNSSLDCFNNNYNNNI